jgi:hypothetical protein
MPQVAGIVGENHSVEVELSKLPMGASGWKAVVDHAIALGDLSEVDWLELKGSLPFNDRSERKRSAVIVARAVLGLANRMPDSASRYMSGHGVVLVGVQGSQVVGVDEVDPAVLHDSLEQYLGEDGPRWDHVFINHPAGLVLAVIVDPPSWGDRIFACRKDYQSENGKNSVRDGEVFVRVPGKTRPATSNDLANLERRRDRSPNTAAAVSVGYGDHFDRIALSSVEEYVEDTIQAMANNLLRDVPAAKNNMEPRYMLAVFSQDPRTRDEFERSVEEWRGKAREKVHNIATEFLRHELARGRWVITNESDRYLEAVRVQVQLPPDVRVLMRSDTEYCDHGGSFKLKTLLPEPPIKFGQMTSLYGAPISTAALRAARMPPVLNSTPEFEVERAQGGVLVTWYVGDLRPRSTELGDEQFALLTDDHLDEIAADWRVTARGVDYVFEGTTMIECAQELHQHLHWKSASHPS